MNRRLFNESLVSLIESEVEDVTYVRERRARHVYGLESAQLYESRKRVEEFLSEQVTEVPLTEPVKRQSKLVFDRILCFLKEGPKIESHFYFRSLLHLVSRERKYCSIQYIFRTTA